MGVWGENRKTLPVNLTQYVPPVDPAHFVYLWLILIAAGAFAMAWFFVYEITVSRHKRSMAKELALATVSSLLLGGGGVFLFLWSGLYV
jgi:hypothetical protein